MVTPLKYFTCMSMNHPWLQSQKYLFGKHFKNFKNLYYKFNYKILQMFKIILTLVLTLVIFQLKIRVHLSTFVASFKRG